MSAVPGIFGAPALKGCWMPDTPKLQEVPKAEKASPQRQRSISTTESYQPPLIEPAAQIGANSGPQRNLSEMAVDLVYDRTSTPVYAILRRQIVSWIFSAITTDVREWQQRIILIRSGRARRAESSERQLMLYRMGSGLLTQLLDEEKTARLYVGWRLRWGNAVAFSRTA